MLMFFVLFYRNDALIIFSGGMPNQTDPQQISSTNANAPPSKPSAYFLTILRGQTTNVLHMDNAIIDFHVVTSSPHMAGELISIPNNFCCIF